MKPRSKSRNILRFLGVTAAAVTATLATSLPANAAVDRTDCGTANALHLYSNTGELCFVNPGASGDLAIYGVYGLRAGDRMVTIAYQGSIGGEVLYNSTAAGKTWEAPMHKIVKIWIW